MLIQIPDESALLYQQAADRARVPLAKYLERQLAKLSGVPLESRALILTGDLLGQVDRLLGLGSTQSPEALRQAVEAWAGISIGDIRLDFTPAQLAEIAHRADKQGKSTKAIVQDIVEQTNRNFFDDPVVAR